MLATGGTDSLDFPATGGAYMTAPQGGGDAYALRLYPGGLVEWATYLGGEAAEDYGTGIAIDAAGRHGLLRHLGQKRGPFVGRDALDAIQIRMECEFQLGAQGVLQDWQEQHGCDTGSGEAAHDALTFIRNARSMTSRAFAATRSEASSSGSTNRASSTSDPACNAPPAITQR